jgi:hypothetical protein
MSVSGSATRKLGQRRASLIGAAAFAVLGLIVSLSSPISAAAATHDHGWQTVARGLDNPRGLAVLSRGRVAVAEAGHAGSVCLGPGECAGLTGQVTVIKKRSRHHIAVATNLPSFGGPFGAFGLGGLAVKRGSLYAIVGLNPQAFGDPAADCQGQPDFDACVATITAVQSGSGLLSRVRSLHADRGLATVASVGEFDFDYAAAHPDPGNP